MQIKHTFLFTLILGLGWIGYAFAYQFGPDTGVNGVFGASMNCTTGCHSSFAVNSGTGGVSVTGLPASWVPGQTYPLTVMVTPATGSRVFGFQLSAVIDGTSPLQQAGTIAKVNNAVQVICGPASGTRSTPGIPCSTAGALQFAEHTNASPTTSFTVNWTAPATAVGTVRFNVAANSANGDFSNQGDRIYTQVYRVDPAVAPPPPIDLSTHAFTILDRGGQSIITDGSGNLSQGQGYAQIQPNAGATTPTGVAIFAFRKNNVLISETGVLAAPKLTTGRMYAEISTTANTALNTGLAIANPNNSPANISFFFTDAAGNPAGSGATSIPANQQIAQFLDTAPFKVYVGATFQGTFSFTSDQPVGVVALRGLFNERNDFLMSTLPIIDTTLPPSNGTVVVPHFADGTGWTTQIFLVNPTDNAMTGNVQFTDVTGVPRNVTIAGRGTSNSFSYSIAARSSQKLATAGTSPGPEAAQGSVRVVPTLAGGASPTALVLFSYKPATITVAEAGVPVTSGTAFRMYVETGTNLDSGIAVANTSSSTVSVTFDVTDLNGAAVSGISPVPISLPPSGQTAKFFSGIFPSLNSFKGVLRITTNSSGISVVGLRTRPANERGDFLITTIPANNEASPASGDELIFPQIANGVSPDGSYTTQFILFSGTAGQASAGNLHFVTQAGAALNLNVN